MSSVFGPPPLVLLAQADGETVPELVVVAEVDVRASLEALEHASLRAEVHRAMVHDGIAVVGTLQPRRRRQRVVGERGGRSHEVVVTTSRSRLMRASTTSLVFENAKTGCRPER